MPETSANLETPANAVPPPAYFLSLTVQNFRCFGPEPQTLDLSDGNGKWANWTIILGENGVGKTTLLQTLVAVAPHLEHGEEIYLPPRVLGRPASVSLSTFNEDGLRHPNENISPARFQAQLVSEPGDSIWRSGFDIKSFGLSMTQCVRSHQSVGNLVCAYGAARRMSQKGLDDSRSEDACTTLFDNSAELLNAEDWLARTDYATKIAPDELSPKKRFERIKGVLITLLPDVINFRSTLASDKITPRLEAKTPYGWGRVRNLSLGYQVALTWLVDFTNRLFDYYPNSENPFAESAICLVDEIDLHLHPKWQRELLRTLSETFPNTQFIVTAHSPLIVQAAPNANLALLRREGDHVVIENDVDYIRNWRVDQILASDLFGEVPVHAPEVEKLLDERTRLMSKAKLTKRDRQRIEELDAEIGRLPTAVHPEDQEAMDIIRRAAALLQRNGGGK